MVDTATDNALAEGAARVGVRLDIRQRTRLLAYLALLSKWNAVYNLTAIRDPARMLTHHLIDSLSIVPYLEALPPGRSLLDVGSGGGLPGVVLAIARPDLQVTVNDIVQKKTVFLTQAKTELALANVTVVAGRVETLTVGQQVAQPFDVIVSRAFAELADFVAGARHLLAPAGEMWAMKGVRPDAEIARLPAGATVKRVIALRLPDVDAQRHLITIEAASSNPNPNIDPNANPAPVA